MKTYIKIRDQEQAAQVRLRRVDPDHGGRATATVVMPATVEEAKRLFSDPGIWSAVYKDDTGAVYRETDCSEYEQMMSVRDDLDGTVCVVMGKPKPEELLEILMGGAENG